jgi:alpha-tubulin suppressor-like RCC1 family protein
VLTSAGRVRCWGYNAYGQLGYGDDENRGNEPNELGAVLPDVLIDPDQNVSTTALHVYDRTSCAILATGRAKCWGINDHGQLGLGDTYNRGEAANEMGADLPAIDLGYE